MGDTCCIPMSDLRPIIVGGCYRSGTSLVRRLLDSHPNIHCGPEVKLFSELYGRYIGVEDPIAHLRFVETARSLLAEDELLEVLGAGLIEMHERAAQNAGKPRWADKTPENVVFLDKWQRLLGDDWVFLHVVRNPLDTLASIQEQRFPRSIPAGLSARIDLYLEFAEAGLRFAERHPERYLRVLYEELVMGPEGMVRQLMAALGERFHAEQLAINAFRHQEGLEDPKAAKTSSVHWNRVSCWHQVLSEAQAEEIVGQTTAIWSKLDRHGRYPMQVPSVGGSR